MKYWKKKGGSRQRSFGMVRTWGKPDAAAQEKSLIPEQEEDREIWEKYLPLLNDARETKVITADGIRIFVEDYRKNPRLAIFGGGHVSQPTAHLGKMLGFQGFGSVHCSL